MTLFVDVGVVRIQEYIDRTQGAEEGQLRKRRGASRMVAAATSPDRFARFDLVANPDAYQPEGVAHLVSREESCDPTMLADRIVVQMRSDLPQAYAEVSWCEAANFGDARKRLRDFRRFGENRNTNSLGIVRSLPGHREDPFAALCKSCGWAAVELGRECRDCKLRDESGKAPKPSSPSPEDRTIDAVSRFLGLKLDRPRDLGTLARLPRSAEAKSNHLATVYADGNAVGALFESIADPALAKLVSADLDRAIRGAGVEALAQLVDQCHRSGKSKGQGYFPGAVTVLAADDVLVSVPASLGWQFVRALIRGFNDTIVSSQNIVDLPATTPRPTLTAGICFHHVKSPMESAIAVAFAAMQVAKKAAPRESAIGWSDLTHPGSAAYCIRFDDLMDEDEQLTAIAQLPASQRNKFLRDLVEAEAEVARVPDGDARERWREQVRRYLASEANRVGAHALHRPDLDLDGMGLRLALTRWWPVPERARGTDD